MEADDLDSMYRTYLSQDYSEEELMDEAVQATLTEDVEAVIAMYNSPIPWVRYITFLTMSTLTRPAR